MRSYNGNSREKNKVVQMTVDTDVEKTFFTAMQKAVIRWLSANYNPLQLSFRARERDCLEHPRLGGDKSPLGSSVYQTGGNLGGIL